MHTVLCSATFCLSKPTHLPTAVSIAYKGPFTNYVDQILTYFDQLPTYRGLLCTFSALPTPCPRGLRNKQD